MFKRALSIVVALAATVGGAALVASPAHAATTKADARFVSFNASPEPIVSGDDLHISGHMDRRASTTWVDYTNRSITLQRKVTGGSYVNWKTITTDGLGNVHYTVPKTTVQASYRLHFAGTSKTKPTTSTGDNVAVVQKNITAVTKVTNWPDTDTTGGIWAQDNFTRTLTVTRGDKLSDGTYVYNFSVKDTGGFISGKNVPSPNDPSIKLHGVVRGSFNGGLVGSFTSASPYLDASNVPATEDAADGKVATSSEWGSLALPKAYDDASFGSNKYSWTYEVPSTCETMTQATEGVAGNITGVNACE